MLKPRLIALCLIVSLSCVPLLAQKTADKDLLERIRKEEATNSQIMKTEHMLADIDCVLTCSRSSAVKYTTNSPLIGIAFTVGLVSGCPAF